MLRCDSNTQITTWLQTVFLLSKSFCDEMFNLNICLQVVDIAEELIESHDLTVDFILTPTRVIKTNCQLAKPQGIIWIKVNSK